MSFGELSLELDGVVLPLQFKTKNLMMLKKITGQGLLSFLAPLMREDRPEGVEGYADVCDPGVLVPLIQAGLAADPRFKKLSTNALEDRITILLDNEAEKRGMGVMLLVGELVGQIVTEVVQTISGGGEAEKGAGEVKNEEPAVDQGK